MGELAEFLPSEMALADRSPCDFCGDRRCRGDCTMARRVRCETCGDEDDTAEAEKPYRLFDFPSLSCRGIELRGWLDQGFTYNPSDPRNRFNGPVTFNDRSNEYQLNQLYLIGERIADTAKSDWDFGGRVDLLYGTDSRFVVANGLETTWNRGQRFYGLALPQLYGDIAFRRWTFRFGHFYSIHGNEVVAAPDNFFYSHSYSFQYGEPFTHTGMLAKYQLSDELSLTAGMVEGWDEWISTNKKLGFLGGVNWTSTDKRTSLAWAVCLSNEQPPGIESTRTLSTVVLSQTLGERWKYIFQNDYGFETNVAGGGDDARWYSLDNYLLYELNERWSFGLRYEWFADENGTRVAGLGTPKGIPLAATPAHWQEASLGVNYKRNPNLLLRSELRWDWVTPVGGASWINGDTGAPGAHGPFDDFSQRHQALWGTDLIVKF